MPLWLSLPAVVFFGASGWISSLDPTGAPGDGMLLWIAAAVAASLVVLRLMRIT
jgi:hypothetical protein